MRSTHTPYDDWIMLCREACDRINAPEHAYTQSIQLIQDFQKEHFIALYLNTRNRVVKKEVISIGTLNANVVHPREVFRTAISVSAAHIIVAHNHPSGDPTPSKEDITITKKLVEAGKIIGIEVLDHVIIGDERYHSMKEAGVI
ncbi:MAG: DNA repair protein RadC [Candidatus Methanoperedens sp.]|nr:DNA repair protein RadC [Candidatus Methanoperedens sp.]